MRRYFIELCVRGILELRGNDNEPAGCAAAAGAAVTDVPVGVVVGDRGGRRVVMSVSTLRPAAALARVSADDRSSG